MKQTALAMPPALNRTSNQNVTKFRPSTPMARTNSAAWKVGPGQFWFQTTQSDLARKLAKRSDTRRVDVSGLNHYRRTFEIRGTRRKVERIIRRYLASASDLFFAAAVAQACSKTVPRVRTAGAAEGSAQ